MRTKDYKTIGFHVSDGIVRLVINQPPSNKMTMEFFGELDHLLLWLQRSGSTRALVIYGSGRHFSSGTDLPCLLDEIEKKMPDNGIPGFLLKNYMTLEILDRLHFPVVAAIRGVCIGSAMELALACHFRFCSNDALFGLPESTFNLMPGLGGIRKVASLAGKARAIQLVIRGETFAASEALKLNLVDRILPKNELIEQSLVFAGSIAEKYRKGKRKIYLGKIFESS